MAEAGNVVLRVSMDLNGNVYDLGQADLGKIQIGLDTSEPGQAKVKVNTDALYGNIIEGLRDAADQLEERLLQD